MNVQIEELPIATDLANEDVFVINKHLSYTAKIPALTVKQSIISEINAVTYQADNTTLGLSADNTFYVKPGGIDFPQLSPNVTFQIDRAVNNSGIGQTVTGSLTTFEYPLTASGNFLILVVDNKAVALRVWDFV